MKHLIFGLWMTGCIIGVLSVALGWGAMLWVWVAWLAVFVPSLTVNTIRWFKYDRGNDPFVIIAEEEARQKAKGGE